MSFSIKAGWNFLFKKRFDYE